MSYEATKNWSIEQLSGAPVISGDEVYLLDKVDMSIDRINMVTDDHTALEKDIYDVQRYDFEYLAKNRNNEIVLFWTEELDFYSARLKQCRDGTLMSPFRLDGRPVHRGKEGDDEPFEFNETGIFRVDCRSSSRPVVQFTNLDTEYISKKIKFPQWNRSDYSEGDCAFFLTPQKLFGINFRHLYLCSIDIEGKNFVEHDLQLGDNVESLLTYENHNLSVYEDHLYVVYSDTPSSIQNRSTVVGRRRVHFEDSDEVEVEEAEEETSEELPMVLAINLNTFEVEKLNLMWPEDVHRPSVSCYITVDENMLYLSGRCAEDCRETHIFRFEKIFLNDEEAQGATIDSQSPNSADPEIPSPKKRRIAESPCGSPPSDVPGPADRCEDCRVVLNETFACNQCGKKACPKCLVLHHQHERQLFHKIASREAVRQKLEDSRRQVEEHNNQFAGAYSALKNVYQRKQESVVVAQNEIEAMLESESMIREDDLNEKLESIEQLKSDMSDITAAVLNVDGVSDEISQQIAGQEEENEENEDVEEEQDLQENEEEPEVPEQGNDDGSESYDPGQESDVSSESTDE